MNWRRGLWRLWIAASAVWLLGVVAFAAADISIPSLTRECSVLLEFEDVSTGKKLGHDEVARCETRWRSERWELVAKAFAPPGLVLIAGLVFGWIIGGFRHRAR